VFKRSSSFSINCGRSTGPLAKGATIAPIEPETGSTLPIVKSTSLTTIPGDAKFSGIFFVLLGPELPEIIYQKGHFEWGI
jgi:hypothetical protein